MVVPPKKKEKYASGSTEEKAAIAVESKRPEIVAKEKVVEEMDVDFPASSKKKAAHATPRAATTPVKTNGQKTSAASSTNTNGVQSTNPLLIDKPEKLDPSLLSEADLSELTDIIYLQQLRIFGMCIDCHVLLTDSQS
jgi:hypothetical protein